ncbi:MAG TPA: FG-GAP-like repeat-containing protein, partial [Myxococcota bacterium]|nr:FG-GAP-like repeat-containing protein [Myxococcota bacterium]
GAGPVRLHLDVEGARAADHATWVRLYGDGGAVLDYREPHAWDARGGALPIRLRAEAGDVVVEVDDAGATYPIEIDPILAAVSLELVGAVGGGRFGYALAGVTDITGDGAGDLIVGADDASGAVGVWVVRSGGALPISSPVSLHTPTSPACGATGTSVGSADVDGDGHEDVVATCRVGANDAVVAWRGDGPALDASSATDPAAIGVAAINRKVASVGDVNGDGFDDVAITSSAGATDVDLTVWSGSPTGFGAALLHLTDPALTYSASFGLGLAGPVDVNGDGYGDLVYAMPRPAAQATSELRVHLGGPAGLPTAPSQTLNPPAGVNNWCKLAAAVGDVNGDGRGDVACAEDIHAVRVYVGTATGLDPTPFAVLRGTDWGMPAVQFGGSQFGAMIAGGGDLDDDGYDDVVVGAPQYATGGARGAIAEYRGGLTGMTATTLVAGSANGGVFGAAGALVPDMDGDGRDEVFVGDYGYDGSRGRVVWYATAGDADHDGVYSDHDCDDHDATIYPGAPEACDRLDQDCDGVADNGTPDFDGDGVCDAFDFQITVGDLVRGQPFTIRTARGPASTQVTFMVSTRGGSGHACYPGSTVCISLQQQIVLGQSRTDAQGVASFTRTLPTNLAPGMNIWIQAAWVVTAGGAHGDVSQVELRQVQ